MNRPPTLDRTLASEAVSALAAAGVLGGFSALADWIWKHYLPDGAILPALVHGALIFLLLALVLGRAAAPAGETHRLLWSLPLSGLAIAAAFYPLARAIGYLGALLVSWAAMWLALALLLRWALGNRERFRSACVRALLAAVGSGLAFWAVSGMWTDPAFDGDVALRFGYWSAAFLPGFLALLVCRGSGRRP